MILPAFVLGILLPAASGWLLLRLLEHRSPVLFRGERIVLGFVLGLTLQMFLVFLAHITFDIPLSLLGFLGIQIFTLLLLGLFAYRSPHLFRSSVSSDSSVPSVSSAPPLPRWQLLLILLLGFWTAAKILLTSVTFLLLTPTFLDDSLDNWNLRGKVFFEDRALTLALPAEDPAVSHMGVSSYPPTVPLAKAWLASLAKRWSDPLINGIHAAWYLAALALVFFALRRRLPLFWSLLGAYLLSSLPLYLMHGTNAYGDVFLSVHVFAAVSQLFFGLTEKDTARRTAHLRIGALAAGLLAFTKNEALFVFLPPLLLLLAFGIALQLRRQNMSRKDAATALFWYAGWIAAIALPWLLFKWNLGLTFGNAKPFTSLGFGWQPRVLLSVAVNTLFEGNWHLLFPLLLLLLLWRWKAAFGALFPLTAFFLIVYLGQMALFLFTGLSVEAVRQTGYARGIIHLAPVMVMLATMLLYNGVRSFDKSEARI